MAESFLTLMAVYAPEDQQRISVWYDGLQQAGFTGSQTPGLWHHVSLATFPLEAEDHALRLMQEAADRFAPPAVDIRHVGVMPGGRVLFAAPDMEPRLTALRRACAQGSSDRFPWLPHTTMLMDEPPVIGRALPTLMQSFQPIRATLDRLWLCAFWPTREIAMIPLKGRE